MQARAVPCLAFHEPPLPEHPASHPIKDPIYKFGVFCTAQRAARDSSGLVAGGDGGRNPDLVCPHPQVPGGGREQQAGGSPRGSLSPRGGQGTAGKGRARQDRARQESL